MSTQRERVRRINAKRPRPISVEVYPVPANGNEGDEAIIDYIVMLLDERDALRKG